VTALLVFSKTTGFRHQSIPAGVRALREIGAEAGFAVDATEDAATFSVANLACYDAVVFLSTSGAVFDDEQREALESYVRGGGGYVGIHAATTTEYDWPFYGELVGARFNGHPPVQKATMVVEDDAHPATAHLDASWTLVDEWYEFTDDPQPRVRVLLSVDEATYEGGQMGSGHPIAWCHDVGAGRSFYTALGHPDEVYRDPAFRAHLLGGIQSVVARQQ
jgi:type 1 glutamine amidotransferase